MPPLPPLPPSAPFSRKLGPFERVSAAEVGLWFCAVAGAADAPGCQAFDHRALEPCREGHPAALGSSALAEHFTSGVTHASPPRASTEVMGHVPGQRWLLASLRFQALLPRRSGPCLTYLLTSGCLEGRQSRAAREVAFRWGAEREEGGGKVPS